MVISLILFVSGSSLYKKVPPEGNVVVQVACATAVCICVHCLYNYDFVNDLHFALFIRTISIRNSTGLKKHYSVEFMFGRKQLLSACFMY